MIKGKTAEEIRKIFNIVNDFTPEEEAQIRKENVSRIKMGGNGINGMIAVVLLRLLITTFLYNRNGPKIDKCIIPPPVYPFSTSATFSLLHIVFSDLPLVLPTYKVIVCVLLPQIKILFASLINLFTVANDAVKQYHLTFG